MPPAKRTTSKPADTKAEDTKAEAPKADKPEVEVERNPELDGNVDKVAEGKAAKDEQSSDEIEKFQKEQERKREKLLKEGTPTSEAYDDPHVNLADLPVNHDPVVTSDHAQASAAASVPVAKVTEGTPVQISQMDTSDFGGNIKDSLSHRAVAKDKDGKDSGKN